jgi:multidrug efflux pump subunit AcrA (membrane-fusion protein)
MPAAVAIPLITAAVGAGTQIVGAKIQSGANKRATAAQTRATDAQTHATDQALAHERDVELRRRQEYDMEQAAARAQWDADQARRAPYREFAESLLRRRAGRVGLSLGDASGPAPMGSMPGVGSSPNAGTTLGSLVGRTPYGERPARRPMLSQAQLGDLARPRGY